MQWIQHLPPWLLNSFRGWVSRTYLCNPVLSPAQVWPEFLKPKICHCDQGFLASLSAILKGFAWSYGLVFEPCPYTRRVLVKMWSSASRLVLRALSSPPDLQQGWNFLVCYILLRYNTLLVHQMGSLKKLQVRLVKLLQDCMTEDWFMETSPLPTCCCTRTLINW